MLELPLDSYEDYTVSIPDFVRVDPARQWGETSTQKWAAFMGASAALLAHPDYDGFLREPPRVAYDRQTDDYYFIFKLDNNGTTFIVTAPIT